MHIPNTHHGPSSFLFIKMSFSFHHYTESAPLISLNLSHSNVPQMVKNNVKNESPLFQVLIGPYLLHIQPKIIMLKIFIGHHCYKDRVGHPMFDNRPKITRRNRFSRVGSPPVLTSREIHYQARQVMSMHSDPPTYQLPMPAVQIRNKIKQNRDNVCHLVRKK